MFREALQIGDGDSIDRLAFVEVCKKHDLVQLVDLVKLSTDALASLCPQSKMKSIEKPNEENERRTRRVAQTIIPVRERKGLASLVKKQQQQAQTETGSDEASCGPNRFMSLLKQLQTPTSSGDSFQGGVQHHDIPLEEDHNDSINSNTKFAGSLAAVLGMKRLGNIKNAKAVELEAKHRFMSINDSDDESESGVEGGRSLRSLHPKMFAAIISMDSVEHSSTKLSSPMISNAADDEVQPMSLDPLFSFNSNLQIFSKQTNAKSVDTTSLRYYHGATDHYYDMIIYTIIYVIAPRLTLLLTIF